ncbi:DUF4149 domain-containing protein [Litoreibacter roseus]|uniref:TMEM205-like domain-containing protein n=1 Tax=Litoreibacter roseus TaxID=2601869 RepID=A0A6N6JEF0_9RHOB|nr:DUF4149 domain-containing protein [Litoreibacter roseus]GFE64337.1 hypothetical protein KIN_14110 [Litoreibacter roseus]
MIDALSLLFIATLFGGMVLYSFGFAAFLFKHLPATEAGALLRQAFPWYYVFVIGIAILAGIFLLISGRVLLSACIAFVLLSAAYARQDLMVKINDASDARAAGMDGAKGRFNLLHTWSVILNFVQLAAVGYVLVAVA